VWTLEATPAPRRCAAYIEKRGFVIVDDFKVPAWLGAATATGRLGKPFERNMNRRFSSGRQFFRQWGLTQSDLPPRSRESNTLEKFRQGPNKRSAGRVNRRITRTNDSGQAAVMIVTTTPTHLAELWEWSGAACGRSERHQRGPNKARRQNYLFYGMTTDRRLFSRVTQGGPPMDASPLLVRR